jgi:hypothetical protein
MMRRAFTLTAVLLTSLLSACGSSGSGGGNSGGGTHQDIPTLSALAPSSTTLGVQSVSLVLDGSNFENQVTGAANGTLAGVPLFEFLVNSSGAKSQA